MFFSILLLRCPIKHGRFPIKFFNQARLFSIPRQGEAGACRGVCRRRARVQGDLPVARSTRRKPSARRATGRGGLSEELSTCMFYVIVKRAGPLSGKARPSAPLNANAENTVYATSYRWGMGEALPGKRALWPFIPGKAGRAHSTRGECRLRNELSVSVEAFPAFGFRETPKRGAECLCYILISCGAHRAGRWLFFGKAKA